MNDVNIASGQNFAEIMITFNSGPGQFQRFLQMFPVNIADRDQAAGILEMSFSHAADPDNSLGQLVAGGNVALSAQNMAVNNEQTTGGGQSCFYEFSS